MHFILSIPDKLTSIFFAFLGLILLKSDKKDSVLFTTKILLNDLPISVLGKKPNILVELKITLIIFPLASISNPKLFGLVCK